MTIKGTFRGGKEEFEEKNAGIYFLVEKVILIYLCLQYRGDYRLLKEEMMTSENVEDLKINQKICEYALGTSLDEINSILGEGYEIYDIIPTLQISGGAIYRRIHGLYVLNFVFLLNASDRKTTAKFRLVNNDANHIQKLNQVLSEENEKGYSLLKIIPSDAFLDPEAGSGIGSGTYGYALFFVKSIVNI